MKIWTYAEARDKLNVDLDLQDQEFITPDELIGYFNEGIEEAESEILKIDEDYLLTPYPVPLVAGTSAYAYPQNMYAFKVRGLVYSNGSIIYDVRRFKRKSKFEQIAFANQYNAGDDYQWYPTNPSAGAARFNLIPASRETAIVPPMSNPSYPMTLWYIRHANRIPITGEYVPEYEQLDLPASIDAANNRIFTTGTYVTGDKVKLSVSAGGLLPSPLVAGTVYYVIAGGTYIKFATSLANAQAGTAIAIASSVSGILSISIAATQSIIDNTLIDIPEFTKFVIQWVKCRCFEKEGDPRLDGAAKTLTQQRDQMVSTLTDAQQDDENEVSMDLSSYQEMS